MNAADSKFPKNVFTYGSLMFEPVWERVVRGKYQCTPAWLNGHVRREIAGELYPGVVRKEGSRVRGLVWLGVEQTDLALLDSFEGVDYDRVEVSLESDVGMNMPAQTYLWKHPERLTDKPWDVKQFAETGLPLFIKQYVGGWEGR